MPLVTSPSSTPEKAPDTTLPVQQPVAGKPTETDKPRDVRNPIAVGQVACKAYEAALNSQGVAALPIKSAEDYYKNVEDAARRMIEFVWKEQLGV